MPFSVLPFTALPPPSWSLSLSLSRSLWSLPCLHSKVCHVDPAVEQEGWMAYAEVEANLKRMCCCAEVQRCKLICQ